jgi:hypothetical protein
MRSEGLSSCFPTDDAMRLRHGWGTFIFAGPKSESTDFQGICASLRGRSGWRWELFSI